MPIASREIRLKSRPLGVPGDDTFEMVSVEVADPAPGQVQVRNLWMSVDPYMRGRMMDSESYAPPFLLGKALQGGAVGEVTASGDPGFAPGDLVQSMFGWREAFTASAGTVQKLETHGLPPQAFLGVAGMPGLTAYVGLTRIAQLAAGDVVFVSAASGAVGSVVCQIARLKGHKVIGSVGGPEKAAHLRNLGIDHVIDYKAETSLTAALKREAPEGIDVYFDNVGGPHLQAALNVARFRAKFAMCGMIAQYNAVEPMPGPTNLVLAIGKELRLQGFIVTNHYDLAPEYLGQLSGWLASGELKATETVEHGLENAPRAFAKLFSGENLGKMLVKLG